MLDKLEEVLTLEEVAHFRAGVAAKHSRYARAQCPAPLLAYSHRAAAFSRKLPIRRHQSRAKSRGFECMLPNKAQTELSKNLQGFRQIILRD